MYDTHINAQTPAATANDINKTDWSTFGKGVPLLSSRVKIPKYSVTLLLY